MRKFQLAALVATTTLAMTSASQAAVIIFDFEDGVAGQPYPRQTYPSLGLTPGYTIVEDALGKHLGFNPAEPYNFGYLQLYGGGGKDIDGHVFANDPILLSFDVFLPNGGRAGVWSSDDYDVAAGVWTTITINHNCMFGCTMYLQGSGQILLDNVKTREQLTALPEPGTWAMMIAGFGLVGAALRRRRGVFA